MIKAFRKLLLSEGFKENKLEGNKLVYSKYIDGVKVYVSGNKKIIDVMGQKPSPIKENNIIRCNVYITLKDLESRKTQLIAVKTVIKNVVESINNHKEGGEVRDEERTGDK